MTETELRTAIKNGPTGGYLLWGDEDYLKKFYLQKLREAVLSHCPPGLEDFNCLSLTLEDGDFSKLADAVSAPPMMAPKKFVEVIPPSANAWKEKERKALSEILDSLAAISDTVLVMLCPRDTLDAGTAKKPTALYKLLTKTLQPVEFALQSGEKLRRWAIRHFEEEGIAIDEDTSLFLMNRCAPDMTTLIKEIDKLICYVKSQNRTAAAKEDIAFVTSPGIREDAFALANAVLAGDRTAALAALDIYKKRKEEPIAVLASLSRVMTDLMTVSALTDSGAEKADIAKALHMHEYKAGLYQRAAAGFGTPRLAAALKRCIEADRLCKSAALGYIPLERFICTIPLGAGKGQKNG